MSPLDLLFPFAPRSAEGLVSLLFWHSLATTCGTPLFRIFNRHWRGDAILHTIAQWFAPSALYDPLFARGWLHPGIDYPIEVGLDRAFALHAGCSLLWLVCAYVQVVHMRKAAHQRFGYVSVAAFALHACAAINNIVVNPVRHGPLPRIMLLYSLFSSACSLYRSIRHAIAKKHGWRHAHEEEFMSCFLMSIQGAGPIRAISQIQTSLGCGVVFCQVRHGAMATACMWPYVNRMLLIALWTLYTRGMYVKSANREQLTRSYLREARSSLLTLSVIFALSCVPHSEALVDLVLGSPGSFHAGVSVALVPLLQTYMDNANRVPLARHDVPLRGVVALVAAPTAMPMNHPHDVKLESGAPESVGGELPVLLGRSLGPGWDDEKRCAKQEKRALGSVA